MGSIILIACCSAASIYILMYRLMPTSWMRSLLLSKPGRALIDIMLFALTALFMAKLAGASMFSMAVGASAAVILTGVISVHAFIVRNDIETPLDFVKRSSTAVADAFAGKPTNGKITQTGKPIIPAEARRVAADRAAAQVNVKNDGDEPLFQGVRVPITPQVAAAL